MAAHELEIILSRQLADCLSIPVFITDPKGNLLFYNEPAENILGKRFEDTGTMPVEEWSIIFQPKDEAGVPLPPEALPLVQTLEHGHPAQSSFWIESLSGRSHLISVTSFPIIGRSSRFLGAIAIFWEKTPTE